VKKTSRSKKTKAAALTPLELAVLDALSKGYYAQVIKLMEAAKCGVIDNRPYSVQVAINSVSHYHPNNGVHGIISYVVWLEKLLGIKACKACT
jgi:hypothetical protein